MTKRKIHIETYLTIFSTFLMGFIDVYTQRYNNSALISAQTGNLVNLGQRLAEGDWYGTLVHLSLITGFALGCAGGFLIGKYVKNHLKNWLIFSSLIYFTAIFRTFIPINLSIIILSAAAGLCLTFFRDMDGLDLNNGIHTGNLKNMWASMANMMIFRKRSEISRTARFGIIIFVFTFGAFVGGFVAKLGPGAMLIFASIICLAVQFAYPLSILRSRKNANAYKLEKAVD
ncbi:MAG: DUF1275 domain-containing protein [Streptococcaceae bacterium]|jgi:uncharacterized membrane protein YoaK (UPF0700 family)|nr:DUF1275 domain-containing protein [Streptococcaceae bacterium]